MKRSWLRLTSLCILLLGGCAQAVQPAASPAVTTTPLPPAPTAIQQPTASATATSTPVATPDIAARVMAAQEPRLAAAYPSPDGRWRAEILIYDCVDAGEADLNAYERLVLVRVADDTAQTADDQLQYCGGLGGFGFAGLFWSPNGRYFYYTNAREGAPEGCGYWDCPLLRLDVEDTAVTYLGGGPRSPDGSRLATWQGQELVMWDVDAGEVVRITAVAPDVVPGPILWSPDSQALAYLQTASYCPLSGRSLVVRVDLPAGTQTVLVESDLPAFGGIAWDQPATLTLFDENGQAWRYTFADGTLLPVGQ